MPTGELITNLRNTVLPHTHLGETIALPILIPKDSVNPADFVVAHRARHVAVLLRAGGNHHPRGNAKRNHLTNQDVLAVHIGILWHKPVLAQLFVVGILHLPSELDVRLVEPLLLTAALVLLLLVLVRAVEDTAKAAPLQERPINHHGILLVIARIRHNRHHDILPTRHLLRAVELADEGRH